LLLPMATCRQRAPPVHPALPGQTSNWLHCNGGCPSARALDFDGRCLVRCGGRLVSECICRPPVSTTTELAHPTSGS
jgi:hypothetical protein